ncbi:MAG: SGNH/GDSL hydrolase family protein [Anaerolineales bacterium]
MYHNLLRSTLLCTAITIILAACGAPTPTPVPATEQPIATEAIPTTTEIASTNTLEPTATPSAPSWTYVAFGDSWPYGAHCNGCRPFPVLYADGLAATTDHRIDFVNLTTNGGTSQSLLTSIQTSEKTREAVKSADIIIIATGGNDLGPAFDAYAAGTCGGADKLDCFRKVAESLRTSFDGILTEIEGLRNGQPTAIRLVTGSNEFLADPGLIELFGADFGKTSGVSVTQMNRDVQCEVAAKHNAKCVDLGLALNGPDLLHPQDVNTQQAMQAVADAILASGLDELR